MPRFTKKLRRVPCNATVSNVPGPPIPLYTAGARIECMYPMSILVPGNGLNVTVMSYRGHMDFGFTVDPDLIPDPWYLADGVPLALAELKERAQQATKGPGPAPAPTAPRAGGPPRVDPSPLPRAR